MIYLYYLRKRFSLFYALVLFVGFAFSAWAEPTSSQSTKPITYFNTGFTVEIHTEGGMFDAVIAFPASFEYKTLSLKNPDRFIVDVEGAVMDGKLTMVPVDNQVVKSLRIAQFSIKPDVVRFVFDLGKPAALEVVRKAETNKLEIRRGIGLTLPPPRIEKQSDRVDVIFPLPSNIKYQHGTVEFPPRIFVDLYGYAPAVPTREFYVGEGTVRQVRVSYYQQAPDVTRVVVDCNLPAAYKVKSAGNGAGLVISVYQPSVYKKKIVVDAGHGGSDPGTMAAEGSMEKDINLAVALKLAEHLKAAGAHVILTRDSDRFISLDERAYIANRAAADVFVSIHVNSLPNHGAHLSKRGTQTYYYADSSLPLAKVMHRNMTEMLGVGDLGIYSRRFVVLRKTRMHAVLCELGYLSHPDDFTLLTSDEFRENAARGIFNGIEEYFGNRGLALRPVELPQSFYACLQKHPAVSERGQPYNTNVELPPDLTEKSNGETTVAAPALPTAQNELAPAASQGNMDVVIRKTSPTRLDKERK